MTTPSGITDRTRQETGAVAQTAKDQAGQVAGTATQAAGEVAGTAKAQAGHVVNEVADQARKLAGEAQQQVNAQSQEQTHRLAGNLRAVADELHRMAGAGQPGSTARNLVSQVAGKGSQAADFLDGRGLDDLLGELRGFARRRPGSFLLGAALAGFTAARVAKGANAAESTPSTSSYDATAETIDIGTPAVPPTGPGASTPLVTEPYPNDTAAFGTIHG